MRFDPVESKQSGIYYKREQKQKLVKKKSSTIENPNQPSHDYVRVYELETWLNDRNEMLNKRFIYRE